MFAYQLFATSRPVTHLRLCCALFLLRAVKPSPFFVRLLFESHDSSNSQFVKIELQSSLRRFETRVLKKREFHLSITVNTLTNFAKNDAWMYIPEYSVHSCFFSSQRNLNTFAKYWKPARRLFQEFRSIFYILYKLIFNFEFFSEILSRGTHILRYISLYIKFSVEKFSPESYFKNSPSYFLFHTLITKFLRQTQLRVTCNDVTIFLFVFSYLAK